MRRTNDDRRVMLGLAVTVVILAVGGIASADFTFGEATTTPWPPTNTIGDDRVRLSSDELTFYSGSDRADGYGGDDLYVSTRSSTDDPWSEPVNLGPTVNSPSGDSNPVITSDGLELYFCSGRPGGYGSNDIWMTKRETKDSPWSQAVVLPPPTNGSTNVWALSISSDDLEMFFVSGNIPGGYGGWDVWSVKRSTRKAPWGEPVNAGPQVNSADWDGSPVLSPDALTLIFSSARLGGFSTMSSWNFDLWMARRETTDAPWGEPVNLGSSVNTIYSEMAARVSADGQMLYFTYRSYEGFRPGGNAGDVWQAPIVPLVDFTGDGKVDGADICTMVDCWATGDSVCDIGPMPWGDGVVDVEDLKVLARYIGEEVDDPTLAAHWALDEAEGIIAHDSVGDRDATIVGAPIWQPDGGGLNGALELNGTTFLVAGSVLNPQQGPFSVSGWVKGGAPGQSIISQQAGYDWLILDSATGALMTELCSGSRQSKALCSDVVIADGNWHRVCFTWDGTNRRLYVDDILVAEDTDVALADCSGGVNIGCGKLMAPNTFFTGLIDDVRIYNRAVKP